MKGDGVHANFSCRCCTLELQMVHNLVVNGAETAAQTVQIAVADGANLSRVPRT